MHHKLLLWPLVLSKQRFQDALRIYVYETLLQRHITYDSVIHHYLRHANCIIHIVLKFLQERLLVSRHHRTLCNEDILQEGVQNTNKFYMKPHRNMAHT